MSQHADIIVVGGGMVGASFAVAMAQLGIKTIVLEAAPLGSNQQPSFDERTVALTLASKRIYDGLGVWPLLDERDRHPIWSIHVSDRGHFGNTRLRREDAGVDALGYVLANRVLGQALYLNLNETPLVHIESPCEVTELIHPDAPGSDIAVRTDRGLVSGRLLVIADGGRSGLAEQAGFRMQAKHYPQQVVVSRVLSNRSHGRRAFERFTSAGPIALLPIDEAEFAVAWTLEAAEAEHVSGLDDDAFLKALQTAFGQRAGVFTQAAARNRYPVKLAVLRRTVGERVVVIGNAAHTVHPVAGQGFNLGLRDVAALAECIANAYETDPSADAGDAALLDAYHRVRRTDSRAVAAFTDGLLSAFAHHNTPTVLARNLSLSALNLMPAVKRELLLRTMGLRARPNRLNRGLGLVASASRSEP